MPRPSRISQKGSSVGLISEAVPPAACFSQLVRLAMRILIPVLLLNICTFAQKSLRSRQIGTEGQLVNTVLAEYDPHSRPPVRDSAAHSAILIITNIFINRVRWQENRAELDIYLRQQWEDSRLRYEVDQREGIQEISIPENREIWTPDTYFSSGSEVGDGEHSNNVVEPSGYVRNSQQRTVDVPFTYGTSFPFINTRSFVLRLGSYKYPVEDVVYLWANSPPLINPVEVSNELLTGSVTFEEANSGDCVGNYTVGVYSCIDVIVTFSSGTTSALFSWFFPSLFLVISSWLHFWVHGSWSVPRTASAALPFFIFAALFVFRQDVVAGSSGQCCWFAFCLFLTFLSFVEYFLVICCGVRRSIRYVANGHSEEHPMGAAKETVEVAYDSRCASFHNNNGLDVISRVAFPVVLLIFLVVYLLFLV
ncbi:unnamed protein product [Caenorhabditis auriculariae]|uniref:Neurotransmitter-gated ion-channel ligand-binding domain-containing protein n=1 Tax=Caenorhabditis auriculariae TaxID=2777116 RepID=A0A8S1HJ45_9PELO|nr:unnamed protein product [Caenorhabditis auriculariae]